MRVMLVVVLSLMFFSSATIADCNRTISPEDSIASLQQAIDDCPDEGTICLTQGHYHYLDVIVINMINKGSITIEGPAFGSGEEPSVIISGDNDGIGPGLHQIMRVIGDGSDDTITFKNIKFLRGETNSGRGGAAYLSRSNAEFKNCHFVGNAAVKGGAIYCDNSSSPMFSDCLFEGNRAFTPYPSEATGNLDGGAVYNNGSFPTFMDCRFRENRAVYGKGGAIMNKAGSVSTLFACRIYGNWSGQGGAGIHSQAGSKTIMSCSALWLNIRSNDSGVGPLQYQQALVENIEGDVIENFNKNFEVTANMPSGQTSLEGLDVDDDGYPHDAGTTGSSFYTDSHPGNPNIFDLRAPESGYAHNDYDGPDSIANFNCDDLDLAPQGAQCPCAFYGSNGGMVRVRNDDADDDLLPDYYDFNPADGDESYDSDCDGVGDSDDICQGFDDGDQLGDDDQVPDGCDGCPEDGNKIQPGICGCGEPDIDSDGDGLPDCIDACPSVVGEICEGVVIPAGASIQSYIDNPGIVDGSILELAGAVYTLAAPINTSGKAVIIRGTLHKSGYTRLDGGNLTRVLICSNNETRETVFQDLVIVNGSANGGAGMFNFNSSPTLINCIFKDNHAYATDNGGGALLNFGASAPKLINCHFENNSAAMWGGAVMNWQDDTAPLAPEYLYCEFTGNQANYGGAVTNSSSDPGFTTCSFIGNTASENGGGIYNVLSDPYFFEDPLPPYSGCLFTLNQSLNGDGGAIANLSSSPIMYGTRFLQNFALQSAGGAIDYSGACAGQVFNAYFEGNTSGSFGGAVRSTEGCYPSFITCNFKGNRSSGGGGFAGINSAAGFTTCSFSENSAFYGGAIYSIGANQSNFVTCGIILNHADAGGGLGGGIANADPKNPVTLSGSNICQNTVGGISTEANQIYGPVSYTGCVSALCDSDGDTVLDCTDGCPNDPAKIEPGICGCGSDDTIDSDGDGMPDDCDLCPGRDDALDIDGDGIPDGCDLCPESAETLDTDGDGIPDDCDLCPGSDDTFDSDYDGTPDGCESDNGCPGDVTGDDVVDGMDLAAILAGWGQDVPELDLFADGVIDGQDLALVLAAWGLPCGD